MRWVMRTTTMMPMPGAMAMRTATRPPMMIPMMMLMWVTRAPMMTSMMIPMQRMSVAMAMRML
eukprot:3398685-Pyramimonas_sp.AAC.1